MNRCRKGFERIWWAFEHVLTDSVTWLFHDFAQSVLETADHTSGMSQEAIQLARGSDNSYDLPASKSRPPIAQYHPYVTECLPSIDCFKALVPHILSPTNNSDFGEDAIDFLEWVDLVRLRSPRIRPGDAAEPYLCRYQLPGSEEASTKMLVELSWRGFLPAGFVRDLVVHCL